MKNSCRASRRTSTTPHAVAGVLILASTTACVAAPSLRLHLDFESVTDALVVDASGNGHTGRLESRAGQPLPQIVGTSRSQALKLEKGKGHGVRVNGAKDLVCAGGLTAMAWVRPDSTRSHLAVIANKSDRVKGRKATGYRLSVFWSRAFMDLGFGDEEGVQCSTPEWTVNPGFWIHIAMTFDGQDMVLFLNATEAARKRLPGPRHIAPHGRDFTIGKFFWNDAYPFTGLIDDVQIHDRALSEAEVFAAACEGL